MKNGNKELTIYEGSDSIEVTAYKNGTFNLYVSCPENRCCDNAYNGDFASIDLSYDKMKTLYDFIKPYIEREE